MKKFLGLSSVAIFFSFFCLAQTAGPNSAANASATNSGAFWANFSGVSAVDNSMMYVDLADYPTCTNGFNCYVSNIATVYGFNFSIPSSATIVGLELSLRKMVGTPTNQVRDSLLKLSSNGTTIGSEHKSSATWPLTFAYVNYGGATDTWNASLTPAIVNDPNFGFQYKLTNPSFSVTAQVEHVTMTIYYSTASGWIESQASNISKVYPNPFNEETTLYLEKPCSNAELNIYSTQGLLLNRYKVEGKSLKISKESLPIGMYFYSVIDRNGLISKGKFNIQD
jgi:hypothetical protein